MELNEYILKLNIEDLKKSLSITEQTSYNSLKKYILSRIDTINSNINLYKYAATTTIMESYLTDLDLLIHISIYLNDFKNKEYFEKRLDYVNELRGIKKAI